LFLSEACYQPFRYHGSHQTLRYKKGIIFERAKEFTQYLGQLRVLGHAIHFSLQILSGNWPLPVILQCLGTAQIVFDFLFKLRLRHHCIERWLRIGALLWPDLVTPVNSFNRSLISYSLCERECSVGNVDSSFKTKQSHQCSGQH
jgi:hypothetical protein